MDITLLQVQKTRIDNLATCFNPCFNGYYTFTSKTASKWGIKIRSFNPCFNGYYTFTKKILTMNFYL